MSSTTSPSLQPYLASESAFTHAVSSGSRFIVDDTRSGAGDHAYLLQVLLILELWQRENGVEAIAA